MASLSSSSRAWRRSWARATALLLGVWIPNFYYWGLNQYITQRTLGSASLGGR